MINNYKKMIRAGIITLFFGIGSSVNAQYCTPTYSTGCASGDDLNSVVLNGITTNLSNLNSGCNGAYSDNTATPAPDLSPGLTYTLSVGTSYSFPQGESVKAWIDYNENDVFDPTEEIAAFSAINAGLNSLSFTVPAATTLGVKRMRVKLDYTSSAANITACGSVTWGETEDYSVEIVTPPNCLPPTALNVSNVQLTSLDFGWTEANTATEWQVDYGALGFTPGTGTGSAAITTSNPYSATIVSGDEYDFYVRSICSAGDTSAWTGPYEFKYCDVSSNGTFYYFNSVSTNGALTNPNYTSFSHPAGSYADETSQIFESHEAQTFTLNTTFSTAQHGVSVWVDWNQDMIFDPSELVATNHSTLADQSLSITVPAGTALGDYRIRVRGMYAFGAGTPASACGSTQGGNTTVDFTLAILTTPSCVQPSALTAGNITTTTAELSWTENGTATAWNIEYGAPGFILGSGTPLPVTANPYTLAITPSTQYEYYVQSDCGGGDLSAWSGPYFFKNTYCDYSSTSNTYFVNGFETFTAISNIANLNTGGGTTTASYSDFTTISASGYELLDIDFTITASGTSTYGFAVFVDWNNDFNFDLSERMFNTTSYTASPLSNSFTVPLGTPVGNYRMRVIADFTTSNITNPCVGSNGEGEDYIFEVITPPTCLPPSSLMTSNPTTTSIELAWTSNSGATSWSIEYGVSGFTPGTPAGTILPGISTNPYVVTGLNPSTNYDFYVQSDCGGGDISALSARISAPTNCGVAVAPYGESFNNSIQPYCWENLSNNTSTSVNNFWKFTGAPGYAATNNGRAPGSYAWSDGSSPYPDSMMLETPEIDISTLANPYLAFEWFSNNENNPNDNVPLIIEVFDGTNWNLLDTLRGNSSEWQFANFSLAAYSSNIIKIRWMTNQAVLGLNSQYNDILVDEILVDDCLPGTGTNGSVDVCRLDSTVNLEDNIIVKPNGGGTWSFPNQPNYLVDDTVFNVSFLPAGSYDVYYLERFVCYDTTFATINVFGPSSAGLDGSTTVCKNEPIPLLGILSGNTDLGGDWYDFQNMLLPNSQPNAQPIPGQYNYTYIVSNGVCPADTSIVEVGVLASCDFLSIETEEFADLSVFPNPSKDILNIVNPSNTTSLKVEMLDINGRVVLVENKALNNATEAQLAIDHLERGIYTLRVYNNTGQKTFKIVKQ
ncbi:GEVED domain-containing protein [Brumimicrobium mesophilum]|uniref:GEVED domain-containing protein n=1 Tax=Brumimicrobium mesophilum TaxID=392717 RepID=UPI000D140030|nr:GEVED domain-containing protein [Brumimicrobium mesophilum]